MGEAKRRRQREKTDDTFGRIAAELQKLGVDVNEFGFYDQPAFIKLEKADPLALELYANWVINRPRDGAYDEHARQTVLQLATIVERRLASENGLGACVNVATMMSRMLDRLRVWSFAVRGSLTIEIPACPAAGRRYFPECDFLDHEDNVTGHGWVVAPPFIVVDPTLKHQKWVDLHPAIGKLLPRVVAAEHGEVIRPRWDDIVSDSVIQMYRVPHSALNADLPYRFKPELARIEKSLPGRDVRVGDLSLRYIAGVVTISDAPLEEMAWVSPASPKLSPLQIWDEDVEPAFRSLIISGSSRPHPD